MTESVQEVQLRHEQEELFFQKEQINKYVRQLRVAAEMLQEFTGFDFSSTLRGADIIEELNVTTRKPVKLATVRTDIPEEAF